MAGSTLGCSFLLRRPADLGLFWLADRPMDPVTSSSLRSPMSAAENQHAMTAFRSLETRSRMLPLREQMLECVQLLQSPQVMVDDLLEVVGRIVGNRTSHQDVSVISTPAEYRAGFFYPSRELSVLGAGCSFTCLATNVQFLEEGPDDTDGPVPWVIEVNSAPGLTCFAKLGHQERAVDLMADVVRAAFA